ncbi:hypothetical protein IL54_1877 [Sphingobium sp. ba1]|nr:hypothetical protein IL54_1877 [Sphingobium sp. ba1]
MSAAFKTDRPPTQPAPCPPDTPQLPCLTGAAEARGVSPRIGALLSASSRGSGSRSRALRSAWLSPQTTMASPLRSHRRITCVLVR